MIIEHFVKYLNFKRVSFTVGHNEFGIFLSHPDDNPSAMAGVDPSWASDSDGVSVSGAGFAAESSKGTRKKMVEMVFFCWVNPHLVLAICIDPGTVGLPPGNHMVGLRSQVVPMPSSAAPGCWRELSKRRTCEATRCLNRFGEHHFLPHQQVACLYALILAVYFSASGHDSAVSLSCSVTQYCSTVNIWSGQWDSFHLPSSL